jgi:mono/diheme cytochrome c family protein
VIMNVISLRRLSPLLGALLVSGLVGVFGCARKDRDPFVIGGSEQEVQQGRQLVEGLAACGMCHGTVPRPGASLRGGHTTVDRYGEVSAANITPETTTGIGEWTPTSVVRVLRGGRGPSGSQLSREVHKGYEWMSDADLGAVVAYLRTLKPEVNPVDRRALGVYSRYVTGVFDVDNEVRGYVPPIDPKFEGAYGGYLTDSVARCSVCHSTPAGWLSSEHYLGGRRRITVDGVEREAPAISGSVDHGIGGWSEEQIVSYLKTGVNPQGHSVDSRFCPTSFFAKAPERDLRAIAGYIRSVK